MARSLFYTGGTGNPQTTNGANTKTDETKSQLAGSPVAVQRFTEMSPSELNKVWAGQKALPKADDQLVPQRPRFHIQVALFLPWRQTWRLKGLSRGRLLHSLSLAPLEETTIELSSWERRRRSLEQSSETETEQDIVGTDSTKDTNEVYDEVQKQSDFQVQVGASLRAAYRPAAAEIEVGVNANLSVRNSVNQVGKNTQQKVHEAVIKSATKVRSRRTTKITETVESGSEQRVTRKIRNPNQCHTLNLDYYEVLAHYEITTEFLPDDTRLCAMIPNPVSLDQFTMDIVLRNETALRDALIERALGDGFDAIRLLTAYSQAKDELKERRADAAAAAKVGKPEKPASDSTTNVKPTREQGDVLAALDNVLKVAGEFNGSYSIDEVLNEIGAHVTITEDYRKNGRRWLYQNLVSSKFPNFISALANIATSADAKLIDMTTVDNINRKLEAARGFGAQCPSSTGNPTLAGINDLSDSDKEVGGLGVAIRRHMAAEWDWAWWSGMCRQEKLYVADDMGVPAAVQRLVEKLQLLDAAPTVADKATQQGQENINQANQDQAQDAAENMLEMKFPLEEVGRARARRNTLLAHLNEHLNYYRYVMFQALPPSEQLDRLMDGSGGALRVGMFEPRVVSVHGALLAVPLLGGNEEVIAKFQENMVATLKNIDKAEDTIMLPTPGMTIESRLGRCSACEEFIEESRNIELRRLMALTVQQEAEAMRRGRRLDSEAGADLGPFEADQAALHIELSEPNVR